MSDINVWDIEGAVEIATWQLLNDYITALTAQTSPALDKDRPRVEAMVLLGSGTGQLAPSEMTGLECDVEVCWQCTVQGGIVTPAIPELHYTLRAKVRSTMQRLHMLVNGKGLKYHQLIGPMRHMNSSPVIEPKKNLYTTTMQYSCLVAIHESAWPLLSQPTLPTEQQ